MPSQTQTSQSPPPPCPVTVQHELACSLRQEASLSVDIDTSLCLSFLPDSRSACQSSSIHPLPLTAASCSFPLELFATSYPPTSSRPQKGAGGVLHTGSLTPSVTGPYFVASQATLSNSTQLGTHIHRQYPSMEPLAVGWALQGLVKRSGSFPSPSSKPFLYAPPARQPRLLPRRCLRVTMARVARQWARSSHPANKPIYLELETPVTRDQKSLSRRTKGEGEKEKRDGGEERLLQRERGKEREENRKTMRSKNGCW